MSAPLPSDCAEETAFEDANEPDRPMPFPVAPAAD